MARPVTLVRVVPPGPASAAAAATKAGGPDDGRCNSTVTSGEPLSLQLTRCSPEAVRTMADRDRLHLRRRQLAGTGHDRARVAPLRAAPEHRPLLDRKHGIHPRARLGRREGDGGVERVKGRALPAGIGPVEGPGPAQPELVPLVPVVFPDGAGVPENEVAVGGARAQRAEVGEVTDEDPLEL